ncbi:MAG: hypothetical protein C0404_09615 [Verrucomicrobia bacterium]|nr:hypothetical protein [Verrucomicrobiota bacterium]
MTEDTELTFRNAKIPAASFLAMLVLISTTSIGILDARIHTPSGLVISNATTQPSSPYIIAPTDWGVRVVEGSTDEPPAERVESAANANRSGHWATATLLSLAAPSILPRLLSFLGFNNVF